MMSEWICAEKLDIRRNAVSVTRQQELHFIQWHFIQWHFIQKSTDFLLQSNISKTINTKSGFQKKILKMKKVVGRKYTLWKLYFLPKAGLQTAQVSL